MKKIIIALLIVSLLPVLSFAGERVRGHWRDTDRDGVKDTYVDSYQRTSPNSTKHDNYSYPGNYNPNKGTYSTGNPDRESSQDYYKSNTQRKY